VCGIAGILSLSGARIDTNRVHAMCDAIRHRGPDGAGFLLGQTRTDKPRTQPSHHVFTESKFAHKVNLPSIDDAQSAHALHQDPWDVFLGHRRLSILDLSSAGFQPMSDGPHNVWVSYNGEIYNFKEVRKKLIACGHTFLSETDTEVLIHAYLEWGMESLHEFNGMFAFALWDKRLNKVFLVRDRYGIKPLYYTRTASNQVLFASEAKAILAYMEEKPRVDAEGLLEYFTFQNFFTDKTLFENIKLLPAGSYVEIELKPESKLIEKQYWDFNFEASTEIKREEDYVEELAFLFEQAVKRQLVSDVDVGSYLSGGMDSGSITAVAAQHLPYMNTFTVGFDLNNASGIELGFDERAKSELLSYLYKTEHYEMVLKSGDMERCLPSFAWHLEEPRVGQSYPIFYASKLASKFVKVVLSGAGGDELFGGYPWRYYRAVHNKDFTDYVDKYYSYWQRLVPNTDIKHLFSPVWDQVSSVWTRDIFESVFTHQAEKPRSPDDYINHSLYFEAKTFLHGLLVVEDKLSMAHGLETRVPFLDNDLVDFSQKIPVNLKLSKLQAVLKVDENAAGDKGSQYYQKTNDGKLILRKALQHYMPDEYTQAVKQGFSSPDNSWFKGDSNAFVVKTLLHEQARLYDYLDRDVVAAKVDEHLSGHKNSRLLIWSLLNVEYFLKSYYA
jgi:asparagine synthase (glutamine-hydrolysing)